MLKEEQKNQLAKIIQKGFPIDPYPYHKLAEMLGISYTEVLSQFEEWYNSKILREISAVMEGDILHYESALVCARVAQEDLDIVVDTLKKHPTITHLYLRNYDFNLWFTISVTTDSGIENHLYYLKYLTGYDYYPLRRKQTCKIGVNFDLVKKTNQTEKTKMPSIKIKFPKNELTEKVKQIIRAIQTSLPLTDRPFKILAKEYSLHEEDLINFLSTSPYGCVRKYIATFNHRNLGVSYNAMTVWKVPETEIELKGNELANFPEVSHCYSRETFSEFPYNLYSMIHGPDESTVHQIVKNISNQIHLFDYLILYSPIEYKKTRLKYFLLDLEEWEKNINILEFKILN